MGQIQTPVHVVASDEEVRALLREGIQVNEPREAARVDRFMRKIMGVMLQSRVRPLRFAVEGDEMLIYQGEKLLIEMLIEDFENLTANQIADDINYIGDKP